MTDQRGDDEDLDLIDEAQDEQEDAEARLEDTADEEDFLSFGDDDAASPEPETDLVKHLRQQIKERDKRLSAAAKQPQAEQPIVVGDRPTMEACEWDQERFDAEFDAWEQRKEGKRQQDQRLETAGRQQQEQWQQVRQSYDDKKRALPFADKEDVERAAFDQLSDVQQAVIAKVADNPALVIYSTKNPARLAALAAIDDPLKLAREIGKMEATMTVKKRARAPDPDRPVRGSTVTMGGSDKRLQELERGAAKSGDRSALIAYKKEKGLL